MIRNPVLLGQGLNFYLVEMTFFFCEEFAAAVGTDINENGCSNRDSRPQGVACAMIALLLAEAIVLVHFAFILFVIFGGLLVLKWRRLIWVHLLAVGWGTLVVAMRWVCPLTPLENHLRSM